MFYVFVIVYLFLVLVVCSLNDEIALFCVRVVGFLFVNKTKWFSCLHLVILFLFLVVLCPILVFSFKKNTKNGHSKKTKKQNAEKKNQTILS